MDEDLKVVNSFWHLDGEFLFDVYIRGWFFWKKVGTIWAKNVDDALKKVQTSGYDKEGIRNGKA